MSASCPLFGDKSYLHLASETTFATLPGSPAYVFHPVTSYALADQPEMRQAMPFTGLAEEFDNQIVHEHVAGQIAMPLYGWRNDGETTSLAEYIMEWCFNDLETLCGLPSKVIEWAEGPDVCNKRTLGSTVNGATLSGGDDGGAAISLSLDILGASEAAVTTAQEIPAGLESLSEFLFSRSTFSIGANVGALVAQPIRSFQWQQNRSLTPVFNGAYNPRYFRPAKPTHTFGIAIEKADGTWDAIRRATTPNSYYGRLVLKGLHNGTGATGNYAVVTIDFPKLSFRGAGENYVRSGVLMQNLNFVPIKPNTTDASYTVTWSEAA